MKLAIKKIKWYSISIKEQSPTKWLTSPVFHLVFCRDEDDRNPQRAYVLHDIIAVRPRKHDVQKHQVKRLLFYQVNRL